MNVNFVPIVFGILAFATAFPEGNSVTQSEDAVTVTGENNARAESATGTLSANGETDIDAEEGDTIEVFPGPIRPPNFGGLPPFSGFPFIPSFVPQPIVQNPFQNLIMQFLSQYSLLQRPPTPVGLFPQPPPEQQGTVPSQSPVGTFPQPNVQDIFSVLSLLMPPFQFQVPPSYQTQQPLPFPLPFFQNLGLQPVPY